VSGNAGHPRVVLVGEETARIVEAIGVVAGLWGTTPTIVGGLAVLCRVQHAHRARTDLDTLNRRNAGSPTRSWRSCWPCPAQRGGTPRE